MSFAVEVEKLDAVRRRLVVTVPEQQVVEELEGAVRDLARSARVPGFRPGRVPRGVLEKRFGDRIRADVGDRLMRSSLAEALEQEKIVPLAPPEILTESVVGDGPLRYSATVEVKPEVEARDYRGLELERPLQPVADRMIDDFLERLRQAQAQLDPIDGRTTAQRGDVVVIDFGATVDGKALDPVEGRQVELGASGFPEGFDSGVEGCAVGESRTIRVQYPEEHSERRLAGKDVAFEVRVQGLFAKKLPDLDDEFAKDVGDCADLAELRERIRGRFAAEAAQRADAHVRRIAMQELARRHEDVELPRSMVARRLEGMIDEVREEWRQRRIWPASDAEIVARLRDEFEPQARDQARLALVLEAIGRQESVEVSEHEIDEAIEQMIAGAEVSAEQAAAYARHPEVRAGVRARLHQAKVLDFVVAQARVTTVEKETDIADLRESD